MEQAQRDSWFKPGQAAPRAEGRPESADGQARPDSGRSPSVLPHHAVRTNGRMAAPAPAVPGAVPSRSPVMPATPLGTTGPANPEAARPFAADIRLASLALALAGVPRLKVTGLRPAADSGDMMADGLHTLTGLALQDETSSPDPEAVRLHAEWQGQDVTVWLGIDVRAESEEARLMQLLPQIRASLQDQRSRLVKLVCNGKTVFEVSALPVSTFSYFTSPKELS